MTTDARQTIDALLTDLKARLAAPGTNLLPLLGVMSRFTQYSLHNQLLIYAQRPDATRVQGYQAWRKAGYQVRKGERGIAIYAPLRFRRDDDVENLADADDVRAERVGFRVAHVFDVAQVDPLPGTAPAPAPAPCTQAIPCLEQLKAFLFGHNVELRYERLSAGCYGWTDGVRIGVAHGLDGAAEFATLVHETAHLLLHFGTVRPDLTVRETEAEAVAYVLCAQFGVAGAELSVDYIRAYRGTPDTLDASLARIRTTAQRLAAALTEIRFDAGT